MLQKNKTSAVILSIMAVFSMLATFVILERMFFIQGEAPILGDFGSRDLLTAQAAISIIFIFIVLPGAFLIHRLDQSHFGMVGGFRWLFFGGLTGALASLIIRILPSTNPEEGFLAFLWNKAIRFGLGPLILGFAYLCSFKLSRLFRRQQPEEHQQ